MKLLRLPVFTMAFAKHARGLAVALIVLVGGCQPLNEHFRRPIMDIDADLLGRHWVITESQSVLDSTTAPRAGCGDGFVVVRYVIDSFGRVFESTVVRGQPQGCYEATALLLLSQWQFEPTPSNFGRHPVRLTQRIPFVTE